MTEINFSPFRTTRIVQSEIQEFLDAVSMAVLAYQEGMIAYLKEGCSEATEEKLQQICSYEARGDDLRSHIGLTLYTEMLLPDTAGDVLSLLADLDHLLDRMRGHFILLGIEKPEFPEGCSEALIDFIGHACSAMEQTVVAARIYFRDPKAVHDQIHKIHYHEEEAEKIAIRLLKIIFAGDYPLERKCHLRDHLLHIDRLADQADETGDALAIYAVKRSI
jgi:predicted phosphate transport protein (TIGR00153 family)